MGKEFLGRGWRFPILPDVSGRLGYSDGDANVEQSLRILLLTRTGERVMRPDLGTRVPDMVFLPGSVPNLRGLEAEVRNVIITHEPRVELLDVLAEKDPREQSRVIVSISYRVRRSNSRNSLVFPYYLQTAESMR